MKRTKLEKLFDGAAIAIVAGSIPAILFVGFVLYCNCINI